MKKLVILSMLLALVLVGCGDGSSKEVVQFIHNNGAEPESLDPHVIEGSPEHNIYMGLFEGLVTYDPETLAAIPGTAESWEVSDDGITWTFKLRKSAKWSDGKKITAQQFVDSWLRMMDPETAAVYAYLPAMVIKGAAAYNAGEAAGSSVGIRALDDYTFQFDLVGPAPYVLGMLSHYAFAVVPLHTIEEFGDDWTKPENMVSNGPFVLKEWLPHDKLVMVKNDNYWDKKNVKLDEVVVLPIDDQNTSVTMYEEGEIDWIEEVPDARLDDMKLDVGYHKAASFITYYYQFNTTIKPFDDARVRKALAMSIDRKELVDNITRGGQVPAYGITPPLAAYPAVIGFKEDYDKAKQLLAEAGFAGGAGFPKTTIIYNTSEGHKRIAEYVQQKWEEILGIEVEIENQEWGTFLDNRQHQNFMVSRSGWQGDYVDPNTFLQDLLHSKSGNNDGKYTNAEFDKLIDDAALLPDGQKRYDMLRKAEEIAIGEDMGIMPFYYYARNNWIDDSVWGGWHTNIQDIHPYKGIYKK